MSRTRHSVANARDTQPASGPRRLVRGRHLLLLIALVVACGAGWLTALAGPVPAAHAEEGEEVEDPVWLDECERYAFAQVVGRCPQGGTPQREDPWAPTIVMEPPPADMDCSHVKLYLDQIFLADCDGDGEPGGKIQPMMSVGLGGTGSFASGAMVPDYGDEENGDILPISECWPLADLPEGISYDLDDPFYGAVRIQTARLRLYCCPDC